MTRRANQFAFQLWRVQAFSQKYFCFSEPQITSYPPTSHPTEGRIMIVTNARWDAMDATAAGAQWDRRAGLPVSDRPARGRTTLLTVFARTRLTARGPARPLARRARTAKSCGPGAPMLASSLAEMHPARPGSGWIVDPQGDGGKQAGHRGEPEVSRKPFAQGKPECSG